MEPGHPFATEELDQMRARQRHQLRLVLREIVENPRVSSIQAPSVPDHHRPFAELMLRQEAEALLKDPSVSEILDTDLTEALERFELLDEIRRTNTRRDGLEALDERLAELQKQTSAEPAIDGVHEDQLYERVFGGVILLVLADKLADDGYEDSRLARNSD